MRRPRSGILLTLAAAAPAFAMAQAQGATPPGGAPSGGIETWSQPAPATSVDEDERQGSLRRDVPAGERGALGDNFRAVPAGPDGQPLDYAPPKPPKIPSVEMAGARLKVLDKMTGQVREVDLGVGETKVEDRLELALLTCRAPEEDARQDAYAYLKIRDLREQAPRFAGWMFASSPALSAMDHARYDVWVLSCSASAGDASSGKE